MNTEQKIIKNKVGLLNLADMLGTVAGRSKHLVGRVQSNTPAFG
jgi:hypothetical protein